jgi:tRNA/rRNA methyltransferase
MPLDRIRVVLVSPNYGGNVGSVCRAMKNMGLSRLVLTQPRKDLDEDEARMMAYRALDVLEGREEYDTLEAAVGDCGLVAGTTARTGLYRSHAKTPRAWAPRLVQAAEQSDVALVFGPENRGLSNEELALCTQVIQIPSSPEYPSLNLAQAVMVCCYEVFLASGQYGEIREPSEESPSELRERMFAKWRAALLDIGFMKEDKADHMMMGLRRILSRGTLTVNDVKILMGIAHQSQWCAGELKKVQSGLRPDPHPDDDERDPAGQ